MPMPVATTVPDEEARGGHRTATVTRMETRPATLPASGCHVVPSVEYLDADDGLRLILEDSIQALGDPRPGIRGPRRA